jgi:hypothetical protein
MPHGNLAQQFSRLTSREQPPESPPRDTWGCPISNSLRLSGIEEISRRLLPRRREAAPTLSALFFSDNLL